MKTNIFSSKEVQNYLYIGLLSLFMVSCGSYQNSSYYETDGIYGASNNRNTETNTASGNYYKDYFNSLQSDSQTSEVITDIDKYSDFDSVDSDSHSSYAGWGNNQTGTIINVYPDYWGMNSGFGWNNWGWNNYWGMNYGFGWNNWGWNNWGWNNWGMNYGFGWNNWGWNYPYYGYNNNYYYYNRPYRSRYSSYAPSRRGSTAVNSSRSYSTDRTYSTNRTYSTSRTGTSRTPTFTNPRTYNSPNRTESTTTRRSSTPTQNNNSRQQQNSNYSRNESYNTPSRSYSTPSYGGDSGSRSYGGGSSSGRSSGGGSRR